MTDNHIAENELAQYARQLYAEEKSNATVEKYVHDVRCFLRYAKGRTISKELALAYKRELRERGYAIRTANSMLAALNSFLKFCGKSDCRVQLYRIQRQTYQTVDRELTKTEYQRLLSAADGKPRLRLLLQTLCATGIRVSELQYFTVEAVKRGEITVECKNKTRSILIPSKLKALLLQYANTRKITEGIIFRTRTGSPLDRSSIWRAIKRLCADANVNPGKVFPHNLRKLFARTFYSIEKDISKLADVLGHSSINTTRLYIMTTGAEHLRLLEQMDLL